MESFAFSLISLLPGYNWNNNFSNITLILELLHKSNFYSIARLYLKYYIEFGIFSLIETLLLISIKVKDTKRKSNFCNIMINIVVKIVQCNHTFYTQSFAIRFYQFIEQKATQKS